ncbi:MAG: DUF3667 domain-containing protein [Bacteroidia bacterium]|nr:DUF3667 domain-containing protein [Bacteroidia bacterium]
MKINPFKRVPQSFDMKLTRTCKVCENTFSGRYCNLCGEKVTEPEERSILNFLDHLLNAFTFLDGKFIKSLKLLLTKPGQLSWNIAEGIRVPYMKMISLFFVANFFYFLFPVYDTYNSTLKTQMNDLGAHSHRATEIVNEHLKNHTMTMPEFQEMYQDKSTNLSKMLIVLLVLMLSVILMVVHYQGKKYFYDHLLFALEFYSFQLLVNLVVLANIFYWVIQGAAYFGMDWKFLFSGNIFSIISTITICYFLFRGQINFYGSKWYWSALKTPLLIFLMFTTIHYYRIALFYITMWFL